MGLGKWPYFGCSHLTCLLPERADPVPCDEPCGSHSSFHHQSACGRNDKAAGPSGFLYQTSPWT